MGKRDFIIAIVYNLESETAKGAPQDLIALQETANTTQILLDTILSLGYQAIKVPAYGSFDDLRHRLSQYPKNNTFIFNNCDGFAGNNLASAKVVEVFEELNFKHTGSSSDVIFLSTDKAKAKNTLIRAGIPTPPFQVFFKPEGDIHLNYPVIVKPLAEDASLGIDLGSIANNREMLMKRVQYVIEQYEQPALVEEFISGREVSVSMWGNEVVETLPLSGYDYSCIEDPLQWVLTYEAKWLPESPYYRNIKVRCPAELNDEDKNIVVDAAIKTYRTIGLRDFGRVDIRLFNGIPFVIDINELPDLSIDSGFPNNAQAAGISYAEMIQHILQLALKREGWL
jgi:D-alanine-D-alanine ligase